MPGAVVYDGSNSRFPHAGEGGFVSSSRGSVILDNLLVHYTEPRTENRKPKNKHSIHNLQFPISNLQPKLTLEAL